MKRSILTSIFIIAAGALGGGAALHAATRHAGAARDSVPTLTAVKTHFTRRVTAEGNLRAVTSTPVLVPEIEGMWRPLRIAWLAPDGSRVAAGDVIVRFDRTDVETYLRNARAELASSEASLHDTQLKAAASDVAHAAAAELAADQAEQTRQNRAQDPLLASRNEITEGELDERVATATAAQAKRARAIDRASWAANVQIAVIAKQRAELTVQHALAALDHLEIRAPRDGILVLHRDDHGDLPKLGAQLCCNEQIAEIPALDVMEAELFVLEADGSGLETGLPADVIVASRPDAGYHGTVQRVDKIAKPRDLWVPVQYFSVVVALDHTDRAVMKPGQRVHATLALETADAITVPRQAVFERGGASVVYRRGAHGFEPVAVELGAATLGRVAITSGLAEGDVIAERDPTQGSSGVTGSGSAATADTMMGTSPGAL